jgi:hypothetical protein
MNQAIKKFLWFIQCFGSESGSTLDPHSMGFWIRIRIANADPDSEGGNQPKKVEKLSLNTRKKLVFLCSHIFDK